MSLVDQVTDGFRQAILSGELPSGAVLPSIRMTGARLGVSIRAPQEAMRRLTAEGLVAARPGVGTVVLGLRKRVWKGHVLIVQPYLVPLTSLMITASAIERRLADAGYMTSTVSVSTDRRTGRIDLSRLEVALKQTLSLVLTFDNGRQHLRMLSRSGIPFVSFSSRMCRERGCVGSVVYDGNAATDALLAGLRARDVRRVLQVIKHPSQSFDVRCFRRAGIALSTWRIDCTTHGVARGESVAAATMRAFLARYRRGKVCGGETLLFVDDYMASGGLTALSFLGIRVPEDIGICTFANVGIGPIYPRPLTRLEYDPLATGERIASWMLDGLGSGTFAEGVSVGPSFVAGETL